MKTKEQRRAIRAAIEAQLIEDGRIYTNTEINNFSEDEADEAINYLQHSIKEIVGERQIFTPTELSIIASYKAEVILIKNIHCLV